jgi:hypothetical protein
VANGGVFKLSAENAKQYDAKINTLSKITTIAISYENNFRVYLTIAEWGNEERKVKTQTL